MITKQHTQYTQITHTKNVILHIYVRAYNNLYKFMHYVISIENKRIDNQLVNTFFSVKFAY